MRAEEAAKVKDLLPTLKLGVAKISNGVRTAEINDQSIAK